jgi:tetratricopeptide (TPR) repeat protein
MTYNNRDWPSFILRLPTWIIGLVTFITTVVGFLKLLQGKTDLGAIVCLVIGVGGVTLGCAYIAFKRTQPLIAGGKGTWQYPKWRSWALLGLIMIPVLTMSGIGYQLYQRSRPTKELIILIANFDGPKSDDYKVNETVLNHLRTTLEEYDNLKVVPLGRAITEIEGSTIARAEGEKHKASIVIWGWYGTTTEIVPLSVHFEIMRPPVYIRERESEMSGRVQTVAVADLESFSFQTNLSMEVTYLSLFTVGVAHFVVEDWDGAVALFSNALDQVSEDMSTLDREVIYFYRGLAYANQCNYDRAIIDYDQAILLNPNCAEAYCGRGVVFADIGEYDRAIADYNQAIQLKPNYAEAYNDRGIAYAQKGNYDRAIADFDQAIKLQPNYAGAYNNRGIAYGTKGDYDHAIINYDQSIQLESDNAEFYTNRGVFYYETGEYNRAVADYDHAIELRPNYPTAYYNRGLVYYVTGDHRRAIADFEQTIRLEPNNAVIYFSRGLIYTDEGNYDRAIADFSQAIQLDPGLVKAYVHRGIAYKLKGERNKAISDFNHCLNLSNDPYWRQQAEEQLLELGVER